MKYILKFILLIYALSAWYLDTSAYELNEADNKIILKLEQKIFTFIDSRWIEIAWVLLDKIDLLQLQKTNERILAILQWLEESIYAQYDIEYFAVVKTNTPVLYSPDFATQFWGVDGVSLNYDRYWEIDAVEFVAFTGTVFSVVEKVDNSIYKVTTREYPVTNDLYIHKSFFSDTSRVKPDERVKQQFSRVEILERLRSIDKADYIWGGNSPEGIPELLDLFPSQWNISTQLKKDWQLTWVDCSGLIYWASGGHTSRNTSWLVEDDTRLDIAWKSLTEISSMLEPLDIIVWKWHMLVVLDEEHTIESAVWFSDTNLKPWVQIRKISDSLWEIMQTKTPVNNYWDIAWGQFVVVRWYEEK